MREVERQTGKDKKTKPKSKTRHKRQRKAKEMAKAKAKESLTNATLVIANQLAMVWKRNPTSAITGQGETGIANTGPVETTGMMDPKGERKERQTQHHYSPLGGRRSRGISWYPWLP
jgi:hypothetical protein